MALAAVLNQNARNHNVVVELFQRIRIGYDAVTGAFRAWSR